jgi:hypothetical protein
VKAEDFNRLEINAKADALWPDGIFLTGREDRAGMVVIYGLYRYFVEVRYNPTSREIERIRAIETEQDFEGYLNSVKPNALLN